MSIFKDFENHPLIFEALAGSDTKDLGATFNAAIGSMPDIHRTRDRLTILYVPREPPVSTTEDMWGFIRGMQRGEADLDVYIFGIAAIDLFAFINTIYIADLPATIRGWQTLDLYGFVNTIPSVPLYAQIKSFKFEDLYAYISGVPPVDLLGYIRGLTQENTDLMADITSSGSFEDLLASIYGQGAADLLASIKSFKYSELLASIAGYTPKELTATINSVYYRNLRASIIGNAESNSYFYALINGMIQDTKDLKGILKSIQNGVTDLYGTLYGIPPSDLYADVTAIPPEYLYGILYATKSKRVIDRIQIDFGPAKDLPGNIVGTGGFLSLPGIVSGIGKGNKDLIGLIDGYAQSDLQAIFVMKFWKKLQGTIGVRTIDTLKNLTASLNSVFAKDLIANIFGTENKLDLLGTITPDGASSTLRGKIRPDAASFYDIITLQTVMSKDLRAIIYSGTACDPYSSFADVYGFIRAFEFGGTDGATLTASIQPKPFSSFLYGSITGGYSFPGDSPLYGSISPSGSFSALQATYWSPISYLRGVVIGEASSSYDLQGQMDIFEWNVFLNATITPRLLLPKLLPKVSNVQYQKKLQSKLLDNIRISFTTSGREYVRSDLLDNTFSVSENTWGVKLSVNVPQQQTTGVLSDKSEERVKVFFDISAFSSFDEAMRYFIDCLAYGFNEGLEAMIQPTGGFKELQSYIIATDPDKVRTITGKVYPVDYDMVRLRADVQGTGGFSGFKSVIFPTTTEVTDLIAEIEGYAQTDLSAYINSVP